MVKKLLKMEREEEVVVVKKMMSASMTNPNLSLTILAVRQQTEPKENSLGQAGKKKEN